MQITDETKAAVLGCTPAQLRAQFAKNARQLRAMAVKARGRKINGYSADQLNEMASHIEACAEIA
jgi:hypothetical protein